MASPSTSAPRHIVGIDLGTTHTVVAAAPVDGGALEDFAVIQTVAPAETAPQRQLPSVVYRAGSELPAESARLPWQEHPAQADFLGSFARSQGAKVPGRVITSAKSWLSVAGVDRKAAILPWGAGDDVEKLSPVDVEARILAHVRGAWDHAHPDAPLAAQDVIVTIPASFDEVARELTLEACTRAGLPQVHLLEEPQAALYAFLREHDKDLVRALAGVRLVLVVDVGGGTTDLTLVAVEHDGDKGAPPRLSRIAVGEHLMLGGDNMDITLARHVEQQLGGAVGALDAVSFASLTDSARAAKELLLSDGAPEEASVSVAARGSKLVGGTRSHKVARGDVERLLVDGFFPLVPAGDATARKRAGLTELGLPYEKDPAITRHIAAFLHRHAGGAASAGARIVDGSAVPDAVLLNGGVFRSTKIRARLQGALARICGGAVPFLGGDAEAHAREASLDLAVARGAAFSGLVRRGRGLRIGGGSARAYFVGVGAVDGRERALCVVPKGMHEGERTRIDRTFRLLLDRPVAFSVFTSTASDAQAGALVDVTDALERLPPLQAVLQSEPELPVRVESFLSEVGTLELSLHATEEALRRFKLAFSTRTDASVDAPGATPAGQIPRAEGMHKRIEDGRALVQAFFGNKSKDVDKARVKDLRRDLEKIFGERDTWSPGTNRELAGALLAGTKNRRRSMDHERAFFQLLGFTLRPGTGAPFDDWRIEQLWPVWTDGVQHVSEKPTWASWFVLWRRVAGGLSAERQLAIWQYLKPWLLEQGTGTKGVGPAPHGQDEMVRLACSLERIPARDKAELGAFVLKKIGRGGIPSWWPLGRLGARAPLFGSAHDVVPPAVVAEWIDKALGADLKTAEGASYALAQMCRVVGDRALDVEEPLRKRVAERLDKAGAPPAWSRMVREQVARTTDDEAQAFGESLPPGLRI